MSESSEFLSFSSVSSYNQSLSREYSREDSESSISLDVAFNEQLLNLYPDAKDFVFIKPSKALKCKIIRSGFLTYNFYLELEGGKDVQLMKAHLKIGAKSVKYTIHIHHSHGKSYKHTRNFGNIKSNFKRDKFILNRNESTMTKENEPIMTVFFDYNFGSPTNIRLEGRSIQNDNSSNFELVTKEAIYDELKRTYQMDFKDRAKMSSSNNIQLVKEENGKQTDIVFQMGKLAKNTYACDFAYPLCAYQAFCISLSAFSKREVF